MTIDHDHLRALADAAAPGSWYTFETKTGRRNGIGSRDISDDEAVLEDWHADEADAEFIAAFDPPTALAVLDENRDLRGRADLRANVDLVNRLDEQKDRTEAAEVRLTAIREAADDADHADDMTGWVSTQSIRRELDRGDQ